MDSGRAVFGVDNGMISAPAANPAPPSTSFAFSRAVNPHNRAEVWQALTDYDAAERTHIATRSGQKALTGLCAALAFGLSPNTAGIFDSCNPHKNPGWQCGSRAAVLCAALGAIAIGILCTTKLVRGRGWLDAQREALAIGLRRGSSPTVAVATSALKCYAASTPEQRLDLKESVWQPAP